MASLSAQTNITVSNPSVLSILQGNYNPSIYASSNVINFPDSISLGIWRDISPDSIKANIIQLSTFKNRNSGSDTMSSTEGIAKAAIYLMDSMALLRWVMNLLVSN
jgi:hypothetical protein